MRFFIKRKFLIVFIIIQHYISSFGWYLPTTMQWNMIYVAFSDYTIPSSLSWQHTTISGVSYNYRAQINAYISAVSGYADYEEISIENKNVHEWASNENNSSVGGDIDQQIDDSCFAPFWGDTKTSTGTSSTAYNCRSVIAF